MERAATLLRKPIPTAIAASVADAVAMASAATTTALRVRRRRNVSRIIASMPFVAATSARTLVMRVPRRKRVKGSTVVAALSQIRKTPTTIAVLANVMGQALAISRNLHKPMARRAR